MQGKATMASSSSSPPPPPPPPSPPTPLPPSDLIPDRTRLRDADGFLGTLRYVGPVASAKKTTELYVGVEWDDPSRGRHDGSVVCRRTNGLVRHFRCRNGIRRDVRRSVVVDGGGGNGSGQGGSASGSSNNHAAASTTCTSGSSSTSNTTAGSFLRLTRRNLDWDTGVPLTRSLLRSRYVPPDAELVAPSNVLPHHALTAGGQKKPIEFLGEVQIRSRQQPDKLDGVGLRSMGISSAPPQGVGEVEEFGHLVEMDLAGNLLCRWEDVLDVLACFPNLVQVGLAGNRIGDCCGATTTCISVNAGNDDDDNDGDGAGAGATAKCGRFDRIRALNLNGTNISTFKTVGWVVGTVMPNLEELCLAHCDLADLDVYDAAPRGDDDGDGGGADGIDESITKLTLNSTVPRPRPISVLSNLRFLDLSDCNLTSWTRQVGRLARSLPRLTDLILNDNPIGSVEAFAVGHDEDDAGADGHGRYMYFPSLTTLQLTNADIMSWSSIDALNAFPNLKSLRFRNNPITSAISAAEARSVTIARLPHLEYLNASPIGNKERVDSERRYVGTVARELLTAETAVAAEMEGKSKDDEEVASAKKERTAAILAHHPRFEALTAKHQDAMSAARAAASGGTAGGGSLSHDAVNVTIRSMAASSCSSEPLRRRLPGSLAVGRVKILCSRAFGLDVDLQTLHFRSGDGADAFPTELDDDDNALSYYGVTDGAEILMNEIDVEARKRDEERAKALQEERIEVQERTATALQQAQTKGFEVKA